MVKRGLNNKIIVVFVLFAFLTGGFLFAQNTNKDTNNQTDNKQTQEDPCKDAKTPQQRKLCELLQSSVEDAKKNYSRRGVFGCTGGIYAPVGLMGPGGAYVPVFDEAVHSQVQLLAYKECVLDPVITHLANSVLAKTVATEIDMVNKQDLIVGNWNDYKNKEILKTVADFVENTCVKNASEENKEACAKIAQEYLQDTKDPYRSLRCDIDAETLRKIKEGEINDPALTLRFISQPACTKLGFYYEARNLLEREIAAKIERLKRETKNNIKPIKAKVKEPYLAEDGTIKYKEVERVVTPASVVEGQLNYAISSGLRRLEQTDEIDEMIQSFFSMLGARVLDASQQGLYGINKILDGEDSYLSSLVNQEEKVASKYKTGTAGLSLSGMINNEKAYLQYKQDSIRYILNAIHDIRNNENTCFEEKIVKGAKEALTQELKDELCPSGQQGQGGGNHNQQQQCNVNVNISTEILPDYLDITEKQDGNTIEHGTFVISGKTSASGSGILSFVNEDKKATTTNFAQFSPWSVEISYQDFPNGDIEVSANYSDGSFVKNNFYKNIIANIPILTLPFDRYKIKIKADATATISGAAGGSSQNKSASKEIILKKDRRYSDPYTNKNSNLFKLLENTLNDIEQTRYVLKQLYVIAKDTKDNPTLASYKIDLLVSKRLVHTASQVRKAKEDLANISGSLSELVKSILQDSWIADGSGWCNKSRWREFEVN